MKRLFVLITFLAAFCVTDAAEAQETESKERPAATKKLNRGAQKQIAAISKRIANSFGDTKLDDAQQAKLNELIEKQHSELNSIRKETEKLISKEDRKKMNEALKAARKEGLKRMKAIQAGFEAIGLSKEDRKAVQDLNKRRTGVINSIKKEIVAMFSQEQTEQWKKQLKKQRKNRQKPKQEKKSEPTAAA